MVCLCMCLNGYLFLYALRHSRHTNTRLEQDKLRRFAVRMAVLTITSTTTWLPLLILQFIASSGFPVTPDAFLWTLIISFSFNLILDPILVLQTAIKMLSTKDNRKERRNTDFASSAVDQTMMTTAI